MTRNGASTGVGGFSANIMGKNVTSFRGRKCDALFSFKTDLFVCVENRFSTHVTTLRIIAFRFDANTQVMLILCAFKTHFCAAGLATRSNEFERFASQLSSVEMCR